MAGRYRIEAMLGRGGMATVYRALDTSTDRQVALKRLTHEADPDRRRQVEALFEREYHALAQLAHPRVVEVHDYGRDDGVPYYTMELLDGSDLRKLAPLPWKQACGLLRDVCSCLALLHSRRMIHRDLSPRNVRCTPDGRAKLIDFGAMAHMGHVKHLVGTAAYTAPEVLGGQEIDGRADLFGLGALAYWALTGRHAYPVHRMRELRDAWRSTPPQPSQLSGDVPGTLDALVMSLMSLDPLGRPVNAAEVIDRLTALADLPPAPELAVERSYLLTPTLVGRDDQQIRFRKRVLRAARGRGGSLLIEGVAGSGLTRMLASCDLDAKLHGALAIRTSADDCSGVDYSALADLVDDLLEQAPVLAAEAAGPDMEVLATVLPRLIDAGVITGRPRQETVDVDAVQQAVIDWVSAMAETHPLCLLIDDFHHCDGASQAVIARLAAAIFARRIVIVVTVARDESCDSARAVELLGEAGGRTVLRALDQEDMHALLRSVFGDVPHLASTARWAHQISHGSPRLCMELAQHLVDAGLARFSAGAWTLPVDPNLEGLPHNLKQTVASRVTSLSEVALSLARLLALVTPFGPLTLADYPALLAGRFSAPDVYRALDELISARMLVTSGDGHSLRQYAVRDAVTRDMSELQARKLHEALAEHYAALDGEGLVVTPYHQVMAGHIQAATERYMQGRGLVEDTSAPAARFYRTPWGVQVVQALERHLAVTGPPADHYFVRRTLLQLAAVVDPRLVSHAPATLAQLRRETGLIHYDSFADIEDRAQRIGACLQKAQQTFEATPAAERCHNPIEAIQELAAVVGMLTGSYARTMDTAKMAGLPELLSPFVPLAEVVDIVHEVVATACETLVRGGRGVQSRRRTLARVATPVDGLDEMTRQGMQDILAYYLALEEAMGVEPEALERADRLELHPNMAALAWQVRLVYHIFHGDWERAEYCRRHREVVVLQHADAYQHLAPGMIYEAVGRVLCNDMMGVRRMLPLLAQEAEAHEGWEPVERYVRTAYMDLRGEHDAAIEAATQALSSIEPGTHTIWGAFAGLQLTMLCRRGDGAEAQAFAQLMASAVKDHELDLVTPEYIEMRSALAAAMVGELDAAVSSVDSLIVDNLDRRGVRLAHLYDVRARLAIIAGDRDEFEAYARRMADQVRPGKTPGLMALYERLMQFARHAESLQVSEIARMASASTVLSVADSTIVTSMETLLGECQGATERAARALQLLVREAGSKGGYLFGIQADGLNLLALRHAPAPDDFLERLAGAFLNDAMGDEDDVTVVESTKTTRGPLAANLRNERGDHFQPFVLRTKVRASHTVIGLVLLRVPEDRVLKVPWQLLEGLSQALIDAGDVFSALG